MNRIRTKRWVILNSENRVVTVKNMKPIQIGIGKKRELKRDQEQWETCNFISKLFRKFIKDLDE